MINLGTVADWLVDVLGDVEGVAVYRDDPGAVVQPPAVMLGPATFTLSGQANLWSAEWPVYVIVSSDESALRRLWDLVPVVVSALESDRLGTVLAATPGSYMSGGAALPAYVLNVQLEIGS